MMSKRDEQAKETKQKIIESARLLIREKGIENVSVDDITKNAGVAKGSYYVYFKKKEDIIGEIGCLEFTYINEELDPLTRNNLGCTLVAAFKTESPKSTVQTACRGYRSEEYPDGIDIDISMYLSSLIPVERGEQWTIEDVLYGNEEKGRKPIQPFINEIKQYDGLIDIIMGIKDLVSARSSHASGVIFFENDPYEHCAFMKTPSGDIITQWDLHEVEYMG